MSFEKEKYIIVKNAISLELADHICTEFQLLSDLKHYLHKKTEDEFFWGEKSAIKSFAWYAPLFGESLLILLKPVIEEIANLSLHPAYSFARIYYPGCVLPVHKDRSSCQFSVSLTLGSLGEIWPLWLKNIHGEDVEINIPKGDMLVYKGCELTHWRNPMPDNVIKQYQVFLHYVDISGPFRNYKFDNRPLLGHKSVR